ncbi:hypothetical protein B0H17DRAFT_1217023 [Mycena rosella]|uniref:Uncharacterized protein n=1 Tax=Mycena rosella TaxID=1033263 RepID=A0AAD7FTS1_MYCRO|nr:hypothetical protein B0H17DRAFT_1217023 [Mycena rosella]
METTSLPTLFAVLTLRFRTGNEHFNYDSTILGVVFEGGPPKNLCLNKLVAMLRNNVFNREVGCIEEASVDIRRDRNLTRMSDIDLLKNLDVRQYQDARISVRSGCCVVFELLDTLGPGPARFCIVPPVPEAERALHHNQLSIQMGCSLRIFAASSVDGCRTPTGGRGERRVEEAGDETIEPVVTTTRTRTQEDPFAEIFASSAAALSVMTDTPEMQLQLVSSRHARDPGGARGRHHAVGAVAADHQPVGKSSHAAASKFWSTSSMKTIRSKRGSWCTASAASSSRKGLLDPLSAALITPGGEAETKMEMIQILLVF